MAFKRGPANALGWRELEVIANTPHMGEEFPQSSQPLLILHHLSDLHICDAQSPLRPEFLDRWADPDSPIREIVGTIGTYRPHAMLSPHVVEAMVHSLNEIKEGPLSGHPIDGAIVTGDTTDNAQVNEVDWYIALLDGQSVRPDSGAKNKYEGVMDDVAEHYDSKYWHPHGTPVGCKDDDARGKYGFPVVAGLLDSCRKPFKATGLDVPWFAVHGNHDALLQGTVAPDEATKIAQVADRRYEALPSTISLEQVLSGFLETGPAKFPAFSDAPYVVVTPDQKRRAVERGEYASKHLQASGLPRGHGFSEENARTQRMYYATDIGQVRLIVLDSVNHFGGWQGSLDEEQFVWLENEISKSPKPVVIASHHPLVTMFNDYAPTGRRICREEISAMLVKYPQVILWLAGHKHRHHVEWIGDQDKNVGLWQVETASHIDWPQQSRTVEIVKDKVGDIYIGLTVVDHAGGKNYAQAQTPLELAALSRLLSANVWQKREEPGRPSPLAWAQGSESVRNTVLKISTRESQSSLN